MAHGKNWRTFPGTLPNWILRLMDPYAHAITTIDELHRLTHDGMAFDATGKVAALANGATLVMLFDNPAGNYPHINRATFDFGLGDIDVVTRKDVVTSASGVSIPTPNANQNSANTANLLLSSAPTITGAGTVLHTSWAVPTASGTGGSAAGVAGVTPGEEWILAPSTKYSVSITNNSGAEIAFAYDVLFYEASYLEK